MSIKVSNESIKTKDLKVFGLIWAFIFLVIAIFPLIKGNEIRVWSVWVSFTFAIISFAYPKIYQQIHFYQGWVKFGNFVGMVNSKIIIGVLFYLIFFPIGLILKIMRKDLLNKKIDKKATSYFVEAKGDFGDMSNQF